MIRQVSESLVKDSSDEVTVFTTFAYNSGLFTNPKVQPMPETRGEEVIDGVNVRRFPVVNRWARLLYFVQYIFYRLRLPGNGFLRMLYYGPISPEMKRAVREFEADVITAAPFPLNHIAYSFKNRNKAPVILVGCMHTADKHGFHNPRIAKLIRRAAGYVALTPHEKEFLVNHYKIDPDKIAVIGVGIDTHIPEDKKDKAGAQAVREETGSGPGDPLIAFVGQHGLHKGIKTLLEAMPRVWEKFPHAKLIISGGTTPFTESFKRLATTINLVGHAMDMERTKKKDFSGPFPNRIFFMDDVDEKQKYNILEACDIFASPSGYESFGITILEAWLKRKPVVACDIQATRNLVDDGETGFLTEYKNPHHLADTLVLLLEDPGLREVTGQKGYEKLIKNYSREGIGNQYRAFYDKIVG